MSDLTAETGEPTWTDAHGTIHHHASTYPPPACNDQCDPATEADYAANHVAPDGYRYGVMFNDGSVVDYWNGRTQRQQAEEHAAKWSAEAREWANGQWLIDPHRVVRRMPGGPWEVVIPPASTTHEEA